MNVSSNTGSESKKPTPKPVILSNKTTGSELKNPASAVISVTPNSDEESENSRNHLYIGCLAYFAFTFLAFTAFMTVVLKSNDDESELICKALKGKFGNDSSSEMKYVSRICENQELTRVANAGTMLLLHLFLLILSCLGGVLAFNIQFNKVGYVIFFFNMAMNMFVMNLYLMRIFDFNVLMMSTLLQFFLSSFMVVKSVLSSGEFKITPMPKNKPVTKNPHKTKPRNDIGKII